MMESSPLTQQFRPEVFEPKIVQLYREVFNVSVMLGFLLVPAISEWHRSDPQTSDANHLVCAWMEGYTVCTFHVDVSIKVDHDGDIVLSEGFWRELFLLPADELRLSQVLDSLTPDDLLHLQVCSASYFVSLDAFAHVLVTNKSILPTSHRRVRIRKLT